MLTRRYLIPIPNKILEILICILSILGGSIIPFPGFIGYGFLVFCIVNILQIILFNRKKLKLLMLLSVYFFVFDGFGVYIHLFNDGSL